jgi:hypothetical protein
LAPQELLPHESSGEFRGLLPSHMSKQVSQNS